MPYEVYKLLHLLGLLLVFISLGAVSMHAASGGDKTDPRRKSLAMTHGIGIVLLIFGGFGMLARLGLPVTSGWVIAKLVLWLVLGAALALPYKARGLARPMLFLLPLIGLLAAYLAIYKPF